MNDWKDFFRKSFKKGIALLLAIVIVISYGLYRSSDRTLRAGGFPEDVEDSVGEEMPWSGGTQETGLELVLDDLAEEESVQTEPEDLQEEEAGSEEDGLFELSPGQEEQPEEEDSGSIEENTLQEEPEISSGETPAETPVDGRNAGESGLFMPEEEAEDAAGDTVTEGGNGSGGESGLFMPEEEAEDAAGDTVTEGGNGSESGLFMPEEETEDVSGETLEDESGGESGLFMPEEEAEDASGEILTEEERGTEEDDAAWFTMPEEETESGSWQGSEESRQEEQEEQEYGPQAGQEPEEEAGQRPEGTSGIFFQEPDVSEEGAAAGAQDEEGAEELPADPQDAQDADGEGTGRGEEGEESGGEKQVFFLNEEENAGEEASGGQDPEEDQGEKTFFTTEESAEGSASEAAQEGAAAASTGETASAAQTGETAAAAAETGETASAAAADATADAAADAAETSETAAAASAAEGTAVSAAETGETAAAASTAESADKKDKAGAAAAGESAAAAAGTGETAAAAEPATGTSAGTSSKEEGRTLVFQGVADTLVFKGPDYTVIASYGEDAGIPAGASLAVSEITRGSDAYREYCEQAQAAVNEGPPEGGAGQAGTSSENDQTEGDGARQTGADITVTDPDAAGTDADILEPADDEEMAEYAQDAAEDDAGSAPADASLEVSADASSDRLSGRGAADPVSSAGAAGDSGKESAAGGSETSSDVVRSVSLIRLFDITIEVNGEPFEPQGPVSVQIVYEEAAAQSEDEEVNTVHFEGEEQTPVLLESKTEEGGEAAGQVSFETESFSVFAVIVTKIEKIILASDGLNYRINVTCGAEARIPVGAQLAAQEILQTPAAQKNSSGAGSAGEDAADSAPGEENASDAPGEDAADSAPEEEMDSDALEEEAAEPAGSALEEDAAEMSGDTAKADAEDADAAADPEEDAADSDGGAEEAEAGTAQADAAAEADADTAEADTAAEEGADAADAVGGTSRPDADAADAGVEDASGNGEYEEYVAKALDALGREAGSVSYARFFEIHIVDAEGNTVQPAPGSTVDVKIGLADTQSETLSVVHFGKTVEVMDASQAQAKGAEGVELSFAAEAFSVYAIVDAPEPVAVGEPGTVQTAPELGENFADGKGFLLSYNGSSGTRYCTNSLNGNSAFVETADISSAGRWYFEKKEGTQDTYTLSTVVGGAKKYMFNKSGNLMELSETKKTAFEVSRAADGLFYFKTEGGNKWLQHSGGGNGIRLWTDNKNAANSRIALTYVSTLSLPDDPYGLNGKTYGIAFHDETATAAALTAGEKASSGRSRLEGLDMLMRPDVLDNDGILLAAAGSDITEWTFTSIEEDRYYITTIVGGAKKTLTIGAEGIALADGPEAAGAVITAAPGKGEYSGKWHFSANGYSLQLPDSAGSGFAAASGTGERTWMNLVEKSVLGDDDFNLYTARKASASDTDTVKSGRQVVLYTRIWNDTTKRYEFFAVDHDGSLIRCYDTGDNIEWIGSRVNTALWTFTEYFNSDGTQNYYYELQNVQYGSFIAPQVTGAQILSDSPVGINLNGRRYGENYTTIIAWDDGHYAYAGLKTQDGHIEACPLSEAEDFYFAVVDREGEAGALTTVGTVDNDLYGITMKMADYDYQGYYLKNPKKPGELGYRQKDQTDVLGYDSTQSPDGDGRGLVKKNLEEDGYPLATYSGSSLSTLYGDRAKKVNHLFIESTYNESGYFEFDSTKNYAYLDGDDFTVYDQLGTNQSNDNFSSLRAHGMFMPYNTLEGKVYSNVLSNMTDMYAKELADTDPRKGERLYEIPAVYPGKKGMPAEGDSDYFFGMEMEASFTQTQSGLDAWGHDIIFEFSGDDDFWLYVDGMLVLDLGGVHSAQSGRVNFRTGEVECNGAQTTLRELFAAAYREKYPDAGEADVSAFLDGVFTQNADGQYVFRDYTSHAMKMLYMERGAGSSNLHMRFNLAAVRPGTVVLHKKLSGTESAENSLIEFPYQILYTTKGDGGETWHLLEEKTDGNYNVLYQGTVSPVPFKERFTPAGGTAEYENVFFLQPGRAAVIDLPDDTLTYTIVECGVDTSVYDTVSVNGAQIGGTAPGGAAQAQETSGIEASGDGGRLDFAAPEASMEERPEVDFDNHVSDGAMRTIRITKRLYDADGVTQLHYPEDMTLFNFRLYLGTENADAANLPLANLYPYFVRDAQGSYCRWDASLQRFVSLGITEYDDLQTYLAGLTSAEKESVIFSTSMNGSISKIPADHTVEVRDLIAGTQWKVEERDYEIPKGYKLRLEDGYTRLDTDPAVLQYDPISGTVRVGSDPDIEVRNQKGWGLTVEKVWTDRDFMEKRDPVYFAVFMTKTPDGQDTFRLLDESVRQLRAGQESVYYFFDDLENGLRFEDYVIREITLSAAGGQTLSADAGGKVTGYDPASVRPVQEGGAVTVGGRPAGASQDGTFTYVVTYKKGQQTTLNQNVRTDTVTNSRPGIALYKTDWEGGALSGAVFTLRDEAGNDVAAASYTTDGTGLITTAYLSPGVYTLAEIRAPKGYVVLPSPLTITVGDPPGTGSDADENGNDDSDASADGSGGQNGAGADGGQASGGQNGAGADGGAGTDGGQASGTNGSGASAGGSGAQNGSGSESGSGSAPQEEALDTITIEDPSGTITVTGPKGLFSAAADAGGSMTAAVTVRNRPTAFRVRKVDAVTGSPVEGVHFALYRQVTDKDGNKVRDYLPMNGFTDLVTDANGILDKISMDLAAGTYYLMETQTAGGYSLLDRCVCFTIGTDGTVAVDPDDDGSNVSEPASSGEGDGSRNAGGAGTGPEGGETEASGADDPASWLTARMDEASGSVSYILAIPNRSIKKVSFKKVDIAAPETSALEGAEFDLYLVTDGARQEPPMIGGLRSGPDGYLAKDGEKIFALAPGTYHLVETAAPDGYTMKEDPVVVTVTERSGIHGVTYEEGSSLPNSGSLRFDREADLYTMRISNSAGYELPATGGAGLFLRGRITLMGWLLVLLALLLRRRHLMAGLNHSCGYARHGHKQE